MNILFIAHDSALSGAPLALEYIIKKLKSSIDDFDGGVLLLQDGPMKDYYGRFCKTAVLDNTEPLFHRILRNLNFTGEYVPDYFKGFKNVKPDLVYANSIASLPTAVAIKKRYGIPVICHCHEPRFLLDSFDLNEDLVKNCDGFIAVSNLCAKGLAEKYDIPEEKIILQHPFSQWLEKILDRGFVPSRADIPNVSDDDFVIGVSGATYWLKSDDLIPLITKRYFDKYPQDKCKFVALGMLHASVGRIFYDRKNCDLEQRLTVLGRTDSPLDYYSRFNVLLLPSRQDSFPLVAEENAVLKKPIVLFHGVTGASEWLDETCSVKVPYLDIEAVVDSIHNLYSDREKCEELGNKAYEKIVGMYSEEKEMKPIVGLVESLM